MSTRRPSSSPARAPEILARAPGFAARRLYQAYSSLWTSAVDPVLTGPQFAVLTAVAANPGADQRSLAEVVSLDTSTLADVVARLEARGLVVREVSERDARRKLVNLTPVGSTCLREANHRARQLDVELLADLPQQRRAQFVADLATVAESWERRAVEHAQRGLPGRERART